MPLIHAPSFGAFGFLPAGGGAFTCDAADFDGTNDYMMRGAGLTGAADDAQGIFSAWIRLDGADGTNRSVIHSDGGVTLFRMTSTNIFQVTLYGALGAVTLRFTTVNTYLPGTTWRHILASWDTNFTVGNKLSHLYVNDVSDKTVVTDSVLADSCDWTQADWGVGGSGAATWNGCIAELYLNTTTYLDFSTEANRRLFISATGKPVDLGADGSTPTGTAPIIYQRIADGGAASDFATNLGSGGNFTITGTLDIASTSPSD